MINNNKTLITYKCKNTENYWILIQLLQYYVMRDIYKLILILLL